MDLTLEQQRIVVRASTVLFTEHAAPTPEDFTRNNRDTVCPQSPYLPPPTWEIHYDKISFLLYAPLRESLWESI